MRRRDFILALGGAAVATVPLAAAAEEYPSRAITLVVNFPPGGSTDAMARILREPLSQGLGQNIIIDNRGGAGGTTGAAAAANAKPDGYTRNCATRPRSTRPFPASSISAGTACSHLPARRRRSSINSMRWRWRR